MTETQLNRYLTILGVVLAAAVLEPVSAAIVLAFIAGLLTAQSGPAS